MGYKISQRGLDELKRQEGFRSTAYRDEGGNWTIGYGHLIKPRDSVTMVSEITREQAEELLRQDLAEAEKAVNRYVDVPLTQGQYDALVSFVFNVGAGAFAESTLLQRLNDGDYDGAAEELRRWDKVTVDGEKRSSEILANRREAEREMWYG